MSANDEKEIIPPKEEIIPLKEEIPPASKAPINIMEGDTDNKERKPKKEKEVTDLKPVYDHIDKKIGEVLEAVKPVIKSKAKKEEPKSFFDYLGELI